MTNSIPAAPLPGPGDTVWFVFHGVVHSGLVARVEPAGKPMAYACVWVQMGKGVTCLHGTNPAIDGDTDHWYLTEAQAETVVNAEEMRRKRIADTHRRSLGQAPA